MNAREIDHAMDLVSTSPMTLRAIGEMWGVTAENIGYHMRRRGVTRGALRTRQFWQKVDQSAGADECWPWTGYRLTEGYGTTRFDGQDWRAHRLVYVMTYGSILSGLLVCHTCDNPPCCNPTHLFLGTDADNSHDRDAKGRQRSPTGAGNGGAKLTQTQVDEIRLASATGEGSRSLGRRFGVSRDAIQDITHGRSWRAARG